MKKRQRMNIIEIMERIGRPKMQPGKREVIRFVVAKKKRPLPVELYVEGKISEDEFWQLIEKTRTPRRARSKRLKKRTK